VSPSTKLAVTRACRAELAVPSVTDRLCTLYLVLSSLFRGGWKRVGQEAFTSFPLHHSGYIIPVTSFRLHHSLYITCCHRVGHQCIHNVKSITKYGMIYTETFWKRKRNDVNFGSGTSEACRDPSRRRIRVHTKIIPYFVIDFTLWIHWCPTRRQHVIQAILLSAKTISHS